MKARLALTLALASLWHRRGVLALVSLTLTLSVTLLLGVQYLRSDIRQAFTSTVSGTDLIVGARSGPINLLLYSVFHIGDATNNIRWSTVEELARDPRIDWLVPLSLGDSYEGFRVVGTDPSFAAHFRYGRDQALQLAEGHWFSDTFDVVLGAEVARRKNHHSGDSIVLAHGGGSTSFMKHRDSPFRVSGVLAATGTPVDRAVYVSLQGLEAIHVGWESGVALPGRTLTPAQARQRDLTPSSVTAVLVGVERKVLTFQLQRAISQYRDEPLSAILPGIALSELWRLLGQFERILLYITGFVVITSLVGLMAVLLALQAQRRQEVAILRATGASPGLIASLYLIECVALTLVACVLAVALGAAGLTLVGPWLLDNYGIRIGLRPLDSTEWLILASVPAAGLAVALIPALRAWSGSRHQGLGGSD